MLGGEGLEEDVERRWEEEEEVEEEGESRWSRR